MTAHSPLSVPLEVAELMYVAFTHTLEQAEANGPLSRDLVDHMRKVLHAYDKARTISLVNKKVPPAAIQAYTKTQAQKLDSWLGKQEKQIEINETDFEYWTKELMNGDDSA